MKKLVQMITIILILFVLAPKVFAINSKVMEEEKTSLNISVFLSEAKKYTQDNFPDLDLGKTLEAAIKGEINNKTILNSILNIFGKEIRLTIKTLASILIIVVIHSIFKAVSENLKNSGISQITYYVQYILIVTIIMSNFTEIMQITVNAINELVSFMYMLTPVLITLIITTGSVISANIVQPILLFAITFIGNIISNIIIPIMLVSTIFSIVSNISDKVQIDKISTFCKSSVTWILRNNTNNFCWIVIP